MVTMVTDSELIVNWTAITWSSGTASFPTTWQLPCPRWERTCQCWRRWRRHLGNLLYGKRQFYGVQNDSTMTFSYFHYLLFNSFPGTFLKGSKREFCLRKQPASCSRCRNCHRWCRRWPKRQQRRSSPKSWATGDENEKNVPTWPKNLYPKWMEKYSK